MINIIMNDHKVRTMNKRVSQIQALLAARRELSGH